MANTTIKLKKSGTSGNTPSTLEFGELSLNYSDGKLFYKNDVGTIVSISNQDTFSTINANSSLILASSPTDTLSIAAGNNIIISACTVSKTITIEASGGTSTDSIARALAQSAYNTANGANGLAAGAYNQANVTIGVDVTQNTRLNSIETINTNQNTSISIIQGVDLEQNTTITAVNNFAQSAFNTANGANGLAAGAFNQANTTAGGLLTANAAITIIQGVNLEQNTAISIIQGVDLTQNTNITAVNNFAAAAYAHANNAFNSGNTFASIQNGIDASQNNRISIIEGVDATQNTQIQVIQGVDLGQNATITAVNQFAGSAFNTANGANGLAAGAFNQANTTAGGLLTANAAITIIQGVDLGQNTSISIIQGVDATQNTRLNSLETINTDQNTAISIIQGVDLGQNATITAVNQYAAAAYAQANTNAGNITVIQGVDLTQNTRIQSIETINSNQNTSISVIQGVDLTQNTQIAGLQGVDLAQNSAISIIQGVDLTQNTNITAVNNFAQSAFNTANGANGLAAGAYNTANTKFNSSGGTISGPVIISANNDLTVTGNLVVLGTTSSVNTETLEVIDPMIILGIGNYTTDAVDIGFAGHYNDGSNAHTGLIRDYATKEYFLFQGYTPELSGNNNVDINHVSFSTANLNAKFIKGNVVATTAVIGGTDFTNYISVTQGVDNTQNTRLNAIETINTNQNNAITIIQGVDLTQNTNITAVNQFAGGAFNTANGANGLAAGAFNQANTTAGGLLTANAAITIIQGVNLGQNTRMSIIEGVDATQNTRLNAIETINTNQNNAITIIQGVDLGQNTTITAVNNFAQSAFNKANTGVTSSSFLANTILVANSTGFVSNSSMSFSASNNTVYLPSNVGIGTTSPAVKLQVNNAATVGTGASAMSAINPIIYMDNGSTANGSIVIKAHVVGSGNTIGATRFVSSPDGSNYSWSGMAGISDATSASSILAFYTASNNSQATSAGASTERMRIDSSGNVGIGTNNPGSKLTVSGGNYRLTTVGTDGTSGYELFDSVSGGNHIGSITRRANGIGIASYDFLAFYTNATASISGGSEKMRVFASGGVSIGNTTDPGASNLSVNGSFEIPSTTTITTYSNDPIDSTNKVFAYKVYPKISVNPASLTNGDSVTVGQVSGTYVPTSVSVNTIFGYGLFGIISSDAATPTGYATTDLRGIYGNVYHNSASNLLRMVGTAGRTYNRSTGTVGNAYSLWARNSTNTGGGTITASYGVYIDSISGGATNYALYSAGGQSYFTGNVGIGSGKTTPATALDVNGTVTATSFSGAGTGLTGTAASLSIGGTAGSETLATVTGRGATTATAVNFTSTMTIGGTDVRGVLTVQKVFTSTFASNTDPTDAGRPFVMQNNSTTLAANQYSNITLQIAPSASLPGGRILGDLRLVRESISSTNSFFMLSAFRQDGTYKDFFKIGYDSSYHIGNLNVGYTTDQGYKLAVNGSFAATTKSFLIPHPTKSGMKLRYGSLEGPENGVYIRGKLKDDNTIELPEYWTKLVDPDSITVNLTPIGNHQNLYVESIVDNKVVIGNGNLINKNINCFFVVYAERVDVDKLVVEQ